MGSVRAVRKGAVNKVWDALVDNPGIPCSYDRLTTITGLGRDEVSGSCSYLVRKYPDSVERVKTGVYKMKNEALPDARLDINVHAGDQAADDVDGDSAQSPVAVPDPIPVPSMPLDDRQVDVMVEELLDMLFPKGVPAGTKVSDMLLLHEWSELTKKILRRFG